MARKLPGTAPEALPEKNPQAGGSYIRCPDTGALTQTEGPDMAQDEAPVAPESTTTNLE